MDALFWWVGCIVVTGIALCVLFVVLSQAYAWLSTAHAVWRAYTNVHDAHPELEMISEAFMGRYGRYWRLVLFGALASQYQWLMAMSCRRYETEWFSIDFRGLEPKISYHVTGNNE